jgi:hypothetical protein
MPKIDIKKSMPKIDKKNRTISCSFLISYKNKGESERQKMWSGQLLLLAYFLHSGSTF